MDTIKAFVARHPVWMYFTLTFAISWTGVLLTIGGFAGMDGLTAQDNPLFPWTVLSMLLGPSVTAVALIALLEGKSGLRQLRVRACRWHVATRWYLVALLVAPLLATGLTLTLSLTSPEFFPGIVVTRHKTSLLILGLAVALPAGLLEEIGWTGFAVPRLRRSYGVYSTGLIVGMFWSAWHLLVVIWGIGDRAGTVPLALFLLVDGLGTLPAFRVLMTSVYERTDSVLIAVLMHGSLTASTLILSPRTAGAPLLTYGVLFALSVWAVNATLNIVDTKRVVARAWNVAG